jgi:phosphotransferase system HPr (HPr) family protein
MAMSGEPLRQTVRIVNPQGFHMRPISAFIKCASRFESTVQLAKADSEAVNGRSVLALMGLGAEQGAELTVEVSGPDAEEALSALVEVLSRPVEEETEPPVSP